MTQIKYKNISVEELETHVVSLQQKIEKLRVKINEEVNYLEKLLLEYKECSTELKLKSNAPK